MELIFLRIITAMNLSTRYFFGILGDYIHIEKIIYLTFIPKSDRFSHIHSPNFLSHTQIHSYYLGIISICI